MSTKGYLIFHLNLAFSSIEEESWLHVIKNCYHPLLDLAEKTGIPIGIELTGWTLIQIEKIDYTWVERFKKLLIEGRCELIGSGYCQLIAPLIPNIVNQWNQRLGLQEYARVLEVKPTIALVNEMAYSSSLVDLYEQFGYHGFVMDRDNIRLALRMDRMAISEVPTHAKGVGDSVLPVLWGDSILFQKVQHYTHGDIAIVDYLDYLKKRVSNGEDLFPIYCNDAEVFDHRPGRFSEERPTHPDGEWNRFYNLLKSIESEVGMEWISPTQALVINDNSVKPRTAYLNSATHPTPVKKQAKYNIGRWAVTGRQDLWLNTMCHRMAKHLSNRNNSSIPDWQEVCELWASDLRTHITEKRWEKSKHKLNKFLKQHEINTNFEKDYSDFSQYLRLETVLGLYRGVKIELDKDGIILKLQSQKIHIELNLRRGLAIQKLAFCSHGMDACIGTLPHGYFSCISLGADYYSGNTVIELPSQRQRITDLEHVTPYFSIVKDSEINIHSEIKTPFGIIEKTITVSLNKEYVSLNYNFKKWIDFIGSVRVGTITFLPEFINGNLKVACNNGGNKLEKFIIDGDVSMGGASSTLVSSTSGLGATTGDIYIGGGDKKLHLNWNPDESAVMPIVQHKVSVPNHLSRVSFSMRELDDTSKASSHLGSFSLKISPF